MPSHDLSVEALLKSADNALFPAKNQGRNTGTYLNFGQI
jgi:PleD family two-component response regulator